MTNKIGIIEFARKGSDEKAIHISARCQYCERIAWRVVDCPEHLQDAPPGYIVYIDNNGRLQAAMEEP